MSGLRIVFMGTPEFAVESLEELISNHFNIVGVVTSQDKPAGRGQLLHQSPVKKYALEKGLNLLQPEKLKDPDFIETLRHLQADLQLVVAFRMLPEVVWNMPALGTFNLHASLLPKYRGAAPINWAIINGETESGVTTFKLQHEIDSGTVLFQERVALGISDTAGDLHDRLMHTGARLLVKTAKTIEEHGLAKTELRLTPQDKGLISHAPKLHKDTCRIDWSQSAVDIYNLIRGLSPYPTAFSHLKNGEDGARTIKLFNSRYTISAHEQPNGLLSTDSKTSLQVYCKDGLLDLSEVQLEGKKRMPVGEFLKGFKIKEGAHLF